MKSILDHVSFFTLDESQKIRVRAYAQSPKLSELDTYEIFKHQHELSMPLAYWDNQISKIHQFISGSDEIGLTPEQITLFEDELSFAFYIFNARYKLALDEGLGHELGDFGNQIIKCNDLMNLLNATKKQDLPELPIVDDDGINTMVNHINFWNERRLYWVWAGRGGLLGSTISLLPDDFFYKTQALNALDVPVPLTGGSSWALYYFRCGIRLGIILRHTLAGSWMSKEEQTIPWIERFSMQLNKYKFNLINDFFWACGNLACFFWLCVTPVADYYGGALTTILLLMDVSVTLWDYSESYAQYIKDMNRFNTSIQMLLKAETANHEQIKSLKNAERQCKLNWDYKLYSLYADIMYAVGLMLAFTLLYTFFLPLAAVSAGTALFWGVTGTVLCFTLNSCFAVIRQSLEICNSVELSNNVAKDFNDNHKKNDFDSNLLKSEWSYHQKVIEYKKACLLRSVLIDFLVPPVVFLSLVFMPLCIGLLTVTAGLILAVASHYYIDKHYPHDIECLPANNSEADLPNPRVIHGFFGAGADLLREKPRSEIVLMEGSATVTI